MAITGAGGTGCHDRLQPPKFRSPPASSPRSLPAARRTVVRERGRWTSVRTHGLAGKRLAPSRERVTPAASRSHRRCSPALRDRRRPAARPPPVRRGSHGAAARRCHCGGCGRCTHTPPSQLEQVGDGGTCGEDVVDRDSVDLDIERGLAEHHDRDPEVVCRQVPVDKMRPERVQRGALRVPTPSSLPDQYVPLATMGGRDDEGRKLAEVGDG